MTIMQIMAFTYHINSINHLLLLSQRIIYSMVSNGRYNFYCMIQRVHISLHLELSISTPKYICHQRMMTYNWLKIVLIDTIMFSLLLFLVLSIIMNYDERRNYHCRGHRALFYPCTVIIDNIYICYCCPYLPRFLKHVIIWCHATHIHTCK